MGVEGETPPGLIIREATVEDNDSLIALELQSPLRIGDVEETYDRSPDFFACHRVLADYRVVLGEIAGRVAGVMVGMLHTPVIEGQPHRLVYIRPARVHPHFPRHRGARVLAHHLFPLAPAP